MAKYLFTSESVSEGHPDKVADQISDALLDAFLEQDKNSRVACETFVTTGQVVVGGEVTTSAYVEVPDLVRSVIEDIGYTKGEYMFESKSCGIFSAIHSQSPDINRGVDKKTPTKDKFDSVGAGDQGMMFGYACKETPELMPAAITYAHQLVKKLADIRKEGKEMTYLRPDAKSQVTLEYDGNTVVRVDTIVVSTQHDPEPKGVTEKQWQERIKEDTIACVINKVIPKHLLDKHTKYFVNPTGRFEIGGPHGDTGLTGRKIIVDTYGGAAPHGGGAFSGKDPSKVDRSAAYAARHIAKNVVGAGLAEKCTVQVSYAIGIARPVSIYVNTHGTGTSDVSDAELKEKVEAIFDLRPAAIIERFGLNKPKGWRYQDTAAYGHFGRNIFPWEKLDKVKDLQRAFK
ncbi:MAG: S-adenosylmethionine synthetase [[Candidatus Thermochlorobacteriaceae] bacterium GBChlB]|nr:MAG: S-adenosylmethionine synthetase [[Candidatus Thermochlorobacteriaceae] bacterium GBChlB]